MLDITRARNFVINRTLQPAIESSATSDRIKNLTKDTMIWVRQFKKTGDLISYMDRFQGEAPSEIVVGMRDAGIQTFEDIHDEFLEVFGASQYDRTRLDDFVIGHEYSAYDIHIFAQNYDVRSGGILPIGAIGNHIAVFIKATLTGGTYPNEWIEKGHFLRYYLKSIDGNFGEHYQVNKAIIDYPEVPIYAFVRETKQDPFVLSGVFNLKSIHREADGSKWFELKRKELLNEQATMTLGELSKRNSRDVELARGTSLNNRQKGQPGPNKKPKRLTVMVKVFARSPYVIAEVLERANGKCEGCAAPAPFNRRKDGTPYLEVHHKKPLSLGGEDSVENALAVCPNCHRREHYGPPQWFATEVDLPFEIEET